MPETLPLFDPSTAHVSPCEGLHDKIELTIGHWDLRGYRQDITRIRERMSGPSEDEIEVGGVSDTTWAGYEVLLTRPSEHQGRLRPQSFRREEHRLPQCPRVQPPLWSGRWEFNSVPGQVRSGHRHYQTELKVSLNPTKYIRYQPLRVRPGSGAVAFGPATHFQRVIRPGFDRVPPQFANEVPLDGTDNWIPQGPRLRLATSELKHSLRESAITGFIAYFDQALRRACTFLQLEEMLLHSRQHVSLRICETYWEFAAPNPVALVDSLSPLLIEFGLGRGFVRTFPFRISDRDTILHSHAVTVDVGAGCELCVYAKTNQRVRFEVRHRMTGDNHFNIPTGEAPVQRSRNSDGGSHTPHSCTASRWDGVYPILERLSEDAANVTNEFFAFLRRRNVVAPGSVTAQTLIEDVLQVVGNRDRAWRLLQLLAAEGRLFTSCLDRSFDSEIRALKRAGVLQPHTGRRSRLCLGVTDRYQACLPKLRTLFEPVCAEAVCRVRLPISRTNL